MPPAVWIAGLDLRRATLDTVVGTVDLLLGGLAVLLSLRLLRRHRPRAPKGTSATNSR